MKNKTSIIVSLIVIGCLLLAWLVKPSFVTNPSDSGTAAADLEVTKAQIEAMLQEHTSEYQRRNRQLLQEFTKRMETLGKEDFARARRNIPSFVDNISSFSFCGKICYRFVVDKIWNTTTTMDLLAPKLGTYICEPCTRGQLKIQDALNEFMLKLQESDTQYRAGLAELAKSEEFQALPMEAQQIFLDDLQKLAGSLMKNAFDTTLIAVGTGLEIIFIRSTISAVYSLMAPLVAKLTTSLTAGGTSALADGPLPFGDILGGVLAIGGFSWTAYDLYRVTKVLPKKLRTEVTRLIDQSEQGMRREALAKATQMVKQCEQNSQKLIGGLTP